MVHEPVERAVLPAPDRHFESIKGKVCPHRRVESPADDPSGKDVGHEGCIHHSRPRRDIGDVRDPQGVRSGGGELPVHQVSRPYGCGVGAGRPGPSAAVQGAGEPSGAYDPFDGAPRDLDPFPVELTPDFPRAVHLVVVLPDSADLDQELFVALCAGRRGPVLGGVIRGWGDL